MARTKLTPADHAEVRRLLALGVKQVRIAHLYGISTAAVSYISTNGRAWKRRAAERAGKPCPRHCATCRCAPSPVKRRAADA